MVVAAVVVVIRNDVDVEGVVVVVVVTALTVVLVDVVLASEMWGAVKSNGSKGLLHSCGIPAFA